MAELVAAVVAAKVVEVAAAEGAKVAAAEGVKVVGVAAAEGVKVVAVGAQVAAAVGSKAVEMVVKWWWKWDYMKATDHGLVLKDFIRINELLSYRLYVTSDMHGLKLWFHNYPK